MASTITTSQAVNMEKSQLLFEDLHSPLPLEEFAQIEREWKSKNKGMHGIQEKFNYAWALIRSDDPNNQEEAVKLFVQIARSKTEWKGQGFMFLIAAEYKRKKYANAIHYAEEFLRLDPDSPHAVEISDILNKSLEGRDKDVKLALSLSGGAAAAIALLGMFLFRKK